VGLVGATVLVVALLGLATKADTHLADGGNTGVVHACAKDKDGATRIVGSTGSCKGNEAVTHWLAAPDGGSGPYLDIGLVVLDTRRGLMWEKKVAGSGCLHCVEDTYDWCNATGIAAGCAVTNNWIAAVNAEAFAGFTDWRVPTRDELAGILLEPFPCDDRNPCIDPIFDPTAASFYWSATEGGPGFALDVTFADGFVFSDFKGSTFRVRALRGGP
jgi:hypothetical protein